MTDLRGRRSTPALLELLIGIVKVANDRLARDQLIRFMANQFDVGRRELGRRIGISHASVLRILNKKQGRGETGARARAASARWRRSRRYR